MNDRKVGTRTATLARNVSIVERTLGGGLSTREGSRNGCDYICITGHRRGCKVEDCNVYVKGKRSKINVKGGWNAKENFDELGEQDT